MSNLCYNCGVPVKRKGNRQDEHIPAKNLSDDFDSSYKINRITVPACDACNGSYSKTDQNLRDLLAIANNDVNSDVEMTRKGAKSVVEYSNWRERVSIDNAGNAVAVSFNVRDLWLYHIKDFKGLYYKKYKVPIGDSYYIDAIPEYDKEQETTFNNLISAFPGDAIWQVSGHESVFKYSIQEIANNGEITQLVGLLVYHGKIRVVVIACKKDYLAAINPRYNYE